MKHYKHLTQEQRYQIHALLKSKASQNEIARIIGVSKSTISRTDFGWAYVEALLARKYSPEQITGRLRYLGWEGAPSHERIYQYVYAEKLAGGSLHKRLRGAMLTKTDEGK